MSFAGQHIVAEIGQPTAEVFPQERLLLAQTGLGPVPLALPPRLSFLLGEMRHEFQFHGHMVRQEIGVRRQPFISIERADGQSAIAHHLALSVD
jgi:hypothetical protein